MRGLNLGKRGQASEQTTGWLLAIIVLIVVVLIVIWFFNTPKDLIKSVGISKIDTAVTVCGEEVQNIHSNDNTAYCGIFKSFDVGDVLSTKTSYLSCYEIAKSASVVPTWSVGLNCSDTISANCRECNSLNNMGLINGVVTIGLQQDLCNQTGLYINTGNLGGITGSKSYLLMCNSTVICRPDSSGNYNTCSPA